MNELTRNCFDVTRNFIVSTSIRFYLDELFRLEPFVRDSSANDFHYLSIHIKDIQSKIYLDRDYHLIC